MPTMQEIVSARNIAAYWNTAGNADVYVTNELFPSDAAHKQLGLRLHWIKGSKGRPIALKPSAFDVAAIPRPHIGGILFKDQMPFFKESSNIDEEMRQDLNMALMTNQPSLIDGIAIRIYEDLAALPRAAAARREMMRCMLLTTGAISITGNGQNFMFDYEMPATNKVTVAKAWSDPTADIISDIQAGMTYVQNTTGEVVQRALCNGTVWSNMLKNAAISSAIKVNGTGTVTSTALRNLLVAEFGMQVVVNDFSYVDGTTTAKYVPNNTFSMFPAGALGYMWYGTTPEEMDLMTGNNAEVGIVDTGVAITTTQIVDPVQVVTKVSQICLPSFEKCDATYILTTSV